MMVWVWLIACAASTTDTGTSSEDTADAVEQAPQCNASWNAWASGFFSTYCTSCHHPNSENRHGAPIGINFHARTNAENQTDPIRARVLNSQDMPLGGGVPVDELVQLDAWLTCVEGDQ
jgi:uncharacterized membrane protein